MCYGPIFLFLDSLGSLLQTRGNVTSFFQCQSFGIVSKISNAGSLYTKTTSRNLLNDLHAVTYADMTSKLSTVNTDIRETFGAIDQQNSKCCLFMLLMYETI